MYIPTLPCVVRVDGVIPCRVVDGRRKSDGELLHSAFVVWDMESHIISTLLCGSGRPFGVWGGEFAVTERPTVAQGTSCCFVSGTSGQLGDRGGGGGDDASDGPCERGGGDARLGRV